MSTPESAVLRAVMDYLAIRGVVCWRNNTGMQTAEYNGKKRVIRYGLGVGSSDVIGIAPGGLLLACEVKAGKNTPTDAQHAFLNRVAARGGIALWCNETNYTDVIDAALGEVAV